jgi:hypothetical protein
LRATFATARTVTRTAYIVADKSHGTRRTMTLVGLGLLVAGVLAMLTDITLLGWTGLGAFAAGAVVLAFCVGGRKTAGVLSILLVLALLLVAAAPWLPWPGTRIFGWLSGTAIPAIADHGWLWPVLLFLILLPPVTTLIDLARGRKKAASQVG